MGRAVGALAAELSAAGVPTPAVDAELLACHVLGCRRGQLPAHRERPLTAGQRRQLQRLGARRALREPLQLIVGSVGFRHLEVAVRPGVFIPRPETETLAEEAIQRVPAGGLVVEPCTGTGAVACAVATESAASAVIATDSSAAAALLAGENAAASGAHVRVLHGSLLDPVDPALRGRVDVIVSNPPYLAEHELAVTDAEVRDWDPVEALVSGPTGHEVADRLIALASEWLSAGGWLLLEVDERRAAQSAQRCRDAGLVDAAVLADLAGRDRVVRARLA